MAAVYLAGMLYMFVAVWISCDEVRSAANHTPNPTTVRLTSSLPSPPPA